MKRILYPGSALCVLMASACAAPAPREPLPIWLVQTAPADAPVRLEQQVTIAGDKIRVCRKLVNRLSRDIFVSRVEGALESGLGTTFLDRAGVPIVEEPFRFHSTSNILPIPGPPGDMSPYSEIKAGAALTDCRQFSRPTSHDDFFVMSSYGSPLSRELVPPWVLTAHFVVTRETGWFASNSCRVRIKRDKVQCDTEVAGRRSAMSVKTLLADSSSAHGRVVTLRGVIRFTHGLASVYSRSGKACVGLLASKDQLSEFARWNGRKVAATGTVDSEGCTRNSICDEHLCGPAILTDVSVRPL